MTKVVAMTIGIGGAFLGWLQWGNGQSDSGWWKGERERIELSQKLQLLKFREERVREAGRYEEWLEANGQLEALRGRAEDLRRERDGLAASVAGMEKEFAEYRQTVLEGLRSAALGKEFEEFESSEGRVFHGARIADIGDAGVTLHHRDGIVRLGFEELTESQRVFFGLEEETAKAAVEDERKRRAAYFSWMEAHREQARREEDREREAERGGSDGRNRTGSRDFTSLAAGHGAMSSQPVVKAGSLSQPARALGNHPGPRYRSTRYRVPRSTRYDTGYPAYRTFHHMNFRRKVWAAPSFLREAP